MRGKPLRELIVPGLALLLTAITGMRLGWAGEVRRWTFAEGPSGQTPPGWKVVAGSWEVRYEANTGNRVLVQRGPAVPSFYRAAILSPFPPVRDVRGTVKMRPLGAGGSVAMGLILQWQDPGTMLIITVEDSPGRIWLKRVQGGETSLRACYMVPLKRDRWDRLTASVQGNWLNLFLNWTFLGGLRIDNPSSGRVGLMAGPNADIMFDDLEVTPLSPLGGKPG